MVGELPHLRTNPCGHWTATSMKGSFRTRKRTRKAIVHGGSMSSLSRPAAPFRNRRVHTPEQGDIGAIVLA